MRLEWCVCKYLDGKLVEKGVAMSRTAADDLKSLKDLIDKGHSYRVVHRSKLK